MGGAACTGVRPRAPGRPSRSWSRSAALIHSHQPGPSRGASALSLQAPRRSTLPGGGGSSFGGGHWSSFRGGGRVPSLDHDPRPSFHVKRLPGWPHPQQVLRSPRNPARRRARPASQRPLGDTPPPLQEPPGDPGARRMGERVPTPTRPGYLCLSPGTKRTVTATSHLYRHETLGFYAFLPF